MGRVIIKVVPTMVSRATKALQTNHSVHHLATKVEYEDSQHPVECFLLESPDFPFSLDPPIWNITLTLHSDPKTNVITLTAEWMKEDGVMALIPKWTIGTWPTYSDFTTNWK